MLCVLILYLSGGLYSLKSILDERFLRNSFIAISFALRRRYLIFGLYHVHCTCGLMSTKQTNYLLNDNEVTCSYVDNGNENADHFVLLPEIWIGPLLATMINERVTPDNIVSHKMRSVAVWHSVKMLSANVMVWETRSVILAEEL